MAKNEIIIEGFCFKDAQTAAQAKRESDGVRYIRENTDMENPEMVLQLYHKLIAEDLFETPVGIGFLKELRDYLSAVPSMKALELEPISVESLLKEVQDSDEEKRAAIVKARKERKKEQDKVKADRKVEKIKKNLRNSLLCNLFLGILVIGMVIVATVGSTPNILSYENKIIDKYAQWQQELEEREQTVKQRERELGITP